MDIETRLTNLENLVASLIKNQDRVNEYNKYDIGACRNTDNLQAENIELNATDIADNRDGLTETFEVTLTNSDDVAINREAIEELYEIILGGNE